MDFNIDLLSCILSLIEIDLSFSFKENYTPLSPLEESLINAKKESTISYPVYQQVFATKHGFIPHLSILDLLFNLGPQSLDYLEQLD
jgi:hypothetical protein